MGLPFWPPLVLFCVLASSAFATYEDQAGQYDWYRQYVGEVLHAHYAIKGNRPSVLVATASRALAQLNLRDGAIMWRQVLGEGDDVAYTALLDSEEGLVSLSGPCGGTAGASSGQHRSFLRLWRALDGQMVWERLLEGACGPAPAALLARPATGAQVALAVSGGVVTSYSIAGKTSWETRLETAGGVRCGLLEVPGGKDAVLAVCGGSSSGGPPLYEAFAISLTTGEVQSRAQVSFPEALRMPLLATGPSLVATSASGLALCSASMAGGKGSCVKASALGLAAGVNLTPPTVVSAGVISIASTSAATDAATTDAALVAVDAWGQLSSLRSFPGAHAISSAAKGGGSAVAAAAPRAAVLTCLGEVGLRVEIVDALTGEVVMGSGEGLVVVQGLGLQTSDGSVVPVARAFLGTYPRSVGSTGYRTLAVLSDDTLVLLQQGQAVWQRPEGLASPTQVLFADLPAPTPAAEAAYKAQQPRWREQLAAELLGLKAQFGLATPEEASYLAERRQAADDKLRPTRDGNGFRKLILLLTRSGSLVALHNGDGHAVWTWRPPSWGGWRPAAAVAWRTPHDLQHAPEVLLLPALEAGNGKGPGDARQQYGVVVDVHTGRQVATVPLPSGASRVLLLPRTLRDGPTEQAVLALVSDVSGISDDGAHVGVLPDTAAARRLLLGASSGGSGASTDSGDGDSSLAPDLHWWRADEATGVVAGYGVVEEVDGGGGGKLRAKLLWTAPLATPPRSAILAVGAPDPTHAVHSHTKVLGDRSLKFKYLSPNLLAVVTGPSPAATASSSSSASTSSSLDPSITLWVLDTVTGRILFSQTHQDAHGPVHLVACEHWVAYHYVSARHRKYQMTVVELYDDSAHNISVADIIAQGRGSADETQSSYEERKLEAVSQSYFTYQVTTPVSIAVTSSAKGLAQKLLLLGTSTGQVYMLDRRLVDPRRPVRPGGKPTAEDQVEGLVPYQEVLPYRTTSYLTLDKQVAGLRGISTSPSALESTTLVLAHGMDLYYTRTAPSGTFDLLGPDFPAALLVAVTTAMTVLVAALRRLTIGKDLQTKWL